MMGRRTSRERVRDKEMERMRRIVRLRRMGRWWLGGMGMMILRTLRTGMSHTQTTHTLRTTPPSCLTPCSRTPGHAGPGVMLSLTPRSTVKKCWTTFCIMLITVSVYMGSSIVSPAITELSEVFGIGAVPATLTLSLFVVGYGVGPLFLSPITEIPQIGRSIPYIVTLAIFCALQAPTATVTNFAGLVSVDAPSDFGFSERLGSGWLICSASSDSGLDSLAPHLSPQEVSILSTCSTSPPNHRYGSSAV